MEKISTEEVIDNLDMFQSKFGKIDEFGWCDLEIISSMKEGIYLDGSQRRLLNSRSSFWVSSSGTSVNERTGRSYMDNVAYNFTLSYGTCYIFWSVYLFFINLYDRSYFSGSTNQKYYKQRRKSDHAI